MYKKERPEFEALFQEILAGRLTRDQAAERAQQQTGLAASTFLGWIRSSGKAPLLKDLRLTVGANHKDSHAKNRPEVEKAYQNALAEVATGKQSIRAVALKYAGQGVSYPWLLARSKKAAAERKERKLAEWYAQVERQNAS